MQFSEQYSYFFFEEVGSTQDTLKKALQDQKNDLIIMHAGQQLQGRGRNQRIWDSNNNDLTFSFSQKIIDSKNFNQIVFLIALRLHAVLKKYLPQQQIYCKWPNDIMVNDLKIAGILMEKWEDFLCIGIGINCVKKENFTSLEDFGINISDKKNFIEQIIDDYYLFYDDLVKNGFQNIREKWLKHAYKLNQKAKVHNFDDSFVEGIFKGIDEEGQLLLQTEQKTLHFRDCCKLEFI